MSATNVESSVGADTLGTVGTNRWYLSAAPIIRALVHLCVPMAAAMIVGAVYSVINAGFIGSLHTQHYSPRSRSARRCSAWSWRSAACSASAAER